MADSHDTLRAQLSELTGMLLSSETLEATLGHVAEIAVRAIPACDGAGVSLFEGDKLRTAAASSPFVQRVDAMQYSSGEGPCLDTIRTGEARRTDRLDEDPRWPKFGPSAVAEGLVSCLALPLTIGNHGTAGALNLYSESRPFQETDEAIANRFVGPASVTVANAHAYAKAQELSEQLHEALESRDIIGQAKGIIQAREGSTAAQAFERLRLISQHRNVKLRDVAKAVVDTPNDMLGNRPPGPAHP